MKTLLLALALSSSLAFAGTIFNDSGSSSIKITEVANGLQFDQVTTGYTVPWAYESPMVLKSVTSARWWNYVDGIVEKTTVTGFSKKTNGKYAKKWAIKLVGGNLKIVDEEVASVTESGCCGSLDIARLININSGKLVAPTITGTLMRAQVPNSSISEGRYLAAVVDVDAPANHNGKVHVGSIGYFSAAGGMISLVRIYAGLPETWGTDITEVAAVVDGTNTAQTYGDLTTIDLWESDGKADAPSAFEKFGITGKFYYAQKIESFTVKVVADKIDMATSTFSADLEAVPVF